MTYTEMNLRQRSTAELIELDYRVCQTGRKALQDGLTKQWERSRAAHIMISNILACRK